MSRWSVLVGGMALGLAILGATRRTGPARAIVWPSIALSGHRTGGVVDYGHVRRVRRGSTWLAGIMDFANIAMAIAAPIATGAIKTLAGPKRRSGLRA